MIPEYIQSIQPNTLLAVTSPLLTFLGLLIAYRANDKFRNPKLKIVGGGIYQFENSVRVFTEVEKENYEQKGLKPEIENIIEDFKFAEDPRPKFTD